MASIGFCPGPLTPLAVDMGHHSTPRKRPSTPSSSKFLIAPPHRPDLGTLAGTVVTLCYSYLVVQDEIANYPCESCSAGYSLELGFAVQSYYMKTRTLILVLEVVPPSSSSPECSAESIKGSLSDDRPLLCYHFLPIIYHSFSPAASAGGTWQHDVLT